MLKALKFVQGAVASKGFAPELTHFRIQDGKVKGFNGSLALSSPIDLDINATPKAVPFIKAIIACKEAAALHMTAAGRLAIKSGPFKAFIECIEEDCPYPDVEPQGEVIPLVGGFIKDLGVVAPFMAEDASKPWARGVLLKGQSVIATNNIVIVERWMEQPFPIVVNLPASAVKELVRIGEEPTHISMTADSMAFFYEDGRWLRTNLIEPQWPDIQQVLDRDSSPIPFPPGFFEAIEDVKPFVDEVGRIILSDGNLCTTQEDGAGALVALSGLPEYAVFNVNHLLKLKQIATVIDFSLYPSPCLFYGDNLRGAIIGMKEL